jgi:hypothetical protein
VKLSFINKYRRQIPNPNTGPRSKKLTVWGMLCDICEKEHVQSEIEIDHRKGHASFTCLEDVAGYFSHLFLVTYDDLRPLCKPCHKIASHAENRKISFEEAKAEKAVIGAMKLGTKEVDALLKSAGYSGATNAVTRRKQLTEHFKKGFKKGDDNDRTCAAG